MNGVLFGNASIALSPDLSNKAEQSFVADQTISTDRDDEQCGPFHIVGVGASAGGLEALQSFFEQVPLDLGVAYVVVQHLSPDFKSHMPELLSKKTNLPVHRAEDGLKVEPDNVYLIPPNKEMAISEEKLLLTDRSAELSHPIDNFLRTLANDVGRYGIAVILSGTGSDGSRGIRDIAENGGLVLVQDEASAKFDGMPLNAINTGVVDVVLRPEAMAPAIVQYVREGLSPETLAERELLASASGIDKIFSALKSHTGVDFSHYKATTIGRRIQRRMSMERIDDIDAYYRRLIEDSQELDDLYYDLLIGVTRFFRDADAFSALRDQVIPELFKKRRDGEPLRIWVAACATGEEVYSIAILLEEHRRAEKISTDYKIFATDVHKSALQIAANARYSREALNGMEEEYVARYLRERKGKYVVSSEIRQKIVFAAHNVFQDAPFTQLDLVACRNMLIYLQPHAQRKTLSLFHFALRTGGVLFLGPSETPGDIQDEFQLIDKRWRLYRKRRDIRLPLDTRAPFDRPMSFGTSGNLTSRQDTRAGEGVYLGTYERLLAENMPPSILTDDAYNVLHTFGGAERFLKYRGGKHSSNLLDIIDEQLKTPVAGALTHSSKDDAEVRYSGILISKGDEAEKVRLVVKPVHDHPSKVTTVLIRFEPMAPLQSDTEGTGEESPVDMAVLSEERIRSLETELRFTRENLQATIEELETSNEELQATNEEMVASNEELQSTNEELQSVNEELYTVNVEHQKRIDELAEATNDMDNLLATTRVGVIYIDDEQCLRRFTPEIGRMFHLMPQDVGRPIASFQSQLDYPDFEDDIRQVLKDEKEIERYVADVKGVPFLARMMPYRTVGGVTGVVLTLVDVTALKKAQQTIERFRHMSEASSDVHAFLNDSGKILYGNPALSKASGKASDELTTLSLRDLDSQMTDERFGELVAQTRAGGASPYNWELTGPGGQLKLEVAVSGTKIGDSWMIFAIGRDITERENKRRELIKAQKAAVAASEAKSSFLAHMSHEIRTPLAAILGFAEMIEQTATEPEQIEHGHTIRHNGEHLLSIVNDVLDLSKIEADKMEFNFKRVPTADLLSDVHALMHVRAEAKKLPFDLVYDTDVPEYIVTDPVRFRQIMLNLIGNAIKFTDSGHVSIHVSHDRGELVVVVADTGIGMTEEDQVALFQPFAQAEATISNHVGGTGLGLTICRRLCIALGGTINLSSREGEGSTFTVRLPAGDISDVKFVRPEGVSTPHFTDSDDRAPLPRLDGVKVLVADDRRDVWRVVEFLLQQAGASVSIASNGREAVRAIAEANEEPFELVFMDLQMPVMDGYEAVAELRERGFELPIIALTAAAMKGERDSCMKAGCNDYLTKPIDATLLIETAKKWTSEEIDA